MSAHRTAPAIAALLLAFAMQAGAAPPPRELVGSSAGAPVYRDQLVGATDHERSESARGLLIAPALREYFEANRAQMTPTAAEVAKVVADMEMARACEPAYMKTHPTPPETRAFVARFLLAGRSTMKHVHQHFGGGRLMFQQAGVEAFDARRRLLEHLEARGRITFNDPAVRALAYDYWTRDHGAWLISDDARIREALDGPIISPCPAAASGGGST